MHAQLFSGASSRIKMSGFPFYSLCVISDPVYMDLMSLETDELVLYKFEIFVVTELSKL